MELNTQPIERVNYTDDDTLDVVQVWKWIRGHQGRYQVSNGGNVRSITRTVHLCDGRRRVIRGQQITVVDAETGYPTVSLCHQGKQTMALVHRLVTQAFIPNPKNKPVVNHKDGNKRNNKVENLEWVTVRENERHAKATGLKASDLRIALCVIPRVDIPLIRQRIKLGERQNQIAKEYGVAPCTINDIWKGRRPCN